MKSAEERIKELELELNSKTSELKRRSHEFDELDSARKKSESNVRELEERLSRERGERERLERELRTNESEIEKERGKLAELEAALAVSKRRDDSRETIREMRDQMEKERQAWAAEKNAFLAKKESDIKELIGQLEKRFDNDYSMFIMRHKTAMENTLAQKNMEHEREKEKLMEIYQEKFNQFETDQLAMQKKIKVIIIFSLIFLIKCFFNVESF